MIDIRTGTQNQSGIFTGPAKESVGLDVILAGLEKLWYKCIASFALSLAADLYGVMYAEKGRALPGCRVCDRALSSGRAWVT